MCDLWRGTTSPVVPTAAPRRCHPHLVEGGLRLVRPVVAAVAFTSDPFPTGRASGCVGFPSGMLVGDGVL